MGLAGFSGSGNHANVWRLESATGNVPDAAGDAGGVAPPHALRLARSQSVVRSPGLASKELPVNPHLLPSGLATNAGGSSATVVPLLGGGSLAQRLNATGPLTASECLVIVASMSNALAALHAVGLVHLDVSPANIVLTSKGCPVLIDTADIQYATGHSCRRGTPPYTVPGADSSPATDWIALGRVVTELASGSAITATSRIPEPLRAPVAELLDGKEPTATLAHCSPSDLLLEVHPVDYIIAPDQRTTIDFAAPDLPPDASSLRSQSRKVAVVACLVVLGLAAAGVWITSAAASGKGPSCLQTTSSAEALLASYPAATIIEADTGAKCPTPVVWLPSSRELVVATSEGPQRFTLGQPGDELSIGDWNCDGIVTPALTRENRFYVFDDWPQQAPVTAIEVNAEAEACTDVSTRRDE